MTDDWPDATVANLPDTAIGTTMRPVITDLEATAPGLLRFGEYLTTAEPNMVYLSDSSGSATGIPPLWGDEGGADHVANAVQEAAIEALWREGKSAVWPVCPDHPGTHPLTVGADGDAVAWVCPSTERIIARVGELGG